MKTYLYMIIRYKRKVSHQWRTFQRKCFELTPEEKREHFWNPVNWPGTKYVYALTDQSKHTNVDTFIVYTDKERVEMQACARTKKQDEFDLLREFWD